jgi:hypothetical protein
LGSAVVLSEGLSLKRTDFDFEALRGFFCAAAKSEVREALFGFVRVGDVDALGAEAENWVVSSVSWVRSRGSWDVMDLDIGLVCTMREMCWERKRSGRTRLLCLRLATLATRCQIAAAPGTLRSGHPGCLTGGSAIRLVGAPAMRA